MQRSDAKQHIKSYWGFLKDAAASATDGTPAFYVWMFVLTALALVGANGWARQVAAGMQLTHMSDHVSWGLYIANFTYMVGLAAGGVMMVIPAYIYGDKEMHELVIVGEVLAIAAITMAIGFVVVDLGRPDRIWHMLPLVGKFNWPLSMLTWDVLVLNGYLLLNLHVVGYLLYQRWLGKTPNPRYYVPFVFLSIGWAISIHTVTAFLYSGLGGRPFWNSALLAPRFLATAFATGPAFLVLSLRALQRWQEVPVPEKVVESLLKVVRVTSLIGLFMTAAEAFTEFYTGSAHVDAARYLYLGLHGHHELVPWVWSSIGLNVVGLTLLVLPATRHQRKWVNGGLVAIVVAVWIEKGMALIIPGFVPSTLHELVPYQPSLTEWKVSVGIWAAGLLIYTVLLRMAAHAIRQQGAPPQTQEGAQLCPYQDW